ncbi:MAG: SpoIIE family protein phosphatase [Porticoccaceae bacterium]|nr:SpoIIE family protein phosphatase [Porticoccaceae bacterium]
MKQKVKSLLLLGSTQDLTSSCCDWLSSHNWRVDRAPASQKFEKNFCRKYQVILVFSEGGNIEAVNDVLRDCKESDAAAVLPVLHNPKPADIVDLVRRGVCDVLLAPYTEQELTDTVERVAQHRNLHKENQAYGKELEKANKELRESLNILKMDQIAGRQVQKNLLPNEPLVHNGYTVSFKIIPSLYLSGDFVAYNLVFDRYILFYIADVSGHGASSAFVTILLRFILKRIIRKHLRDHDVKALAKAPEGFVEHVNRQLLATGLEKQLTMFAGSIDTQNNLLRYSVAAQMPMPVFVTEHDARYLPGKGKIIGLFEDVTWVVEEIALPKQFQLVMVSDGLLETLPAKGLTAQEQYLLDTLAAAEPNHAGICRALGLDKIREAADDVSIMTICRESAP